MGENKHGARSVQEMSKYPPKSCYLLKHSRTETTTDCEQVKDTELQSADHKRDLDMRADQRLMGLEIYEKQLLWCGQNTQ